MVERLSRLRAEQPARWGRFTAPQMITHLLEAMRMAKGELAVRPRALPFQFLIRPLFIHVLPFPKGAPTAPQLLSRKPVEWDRDVAELRAAIESVRAPAPGATLPDHPVFGRMSSRDWGVLLHKHLDHHFRQFAV